MIVLSQKDLLDINLIAARHGGWRLSFYPTNSEHLMLLVTIAERRDDEIIVEAKIILLRHSLHAAGWFSVVLPPGSDQAVAVEFKWEDTTAEPALPGRLLWALENQVQFAGRTLLSGSIQIGKDAEPYHQLLTANQYQFEILPNIEGYVINFEKKITSYRTGTLFSHHQKRVSDYVSSHQEL